MTSEEYVNQVNRLMDLQTTYLNIFLWFLGVVIAIMLALQWWLNSKQMKQIKELTRRETIKEIEESLGVSDLNSFKIDIEKQIENIKKDRDETEANQLYNKIVLLQYEEKFLWRIPLIMDEYNRYISDNIRNFDFFVNNVSGLITHTQNEGKLKEGINSDWIDKILQEMTRIEVGFNGKSESLESLNKLISIYRREEN